ncbi:5782_t:CDS:2, partial [Racocetra persica]
FNNDDSEQFDDEVESISISTQVEFEKELDRSRREFIQFNQELDEIARSMKQLFEGSPHFLAGMEEIKQKQDDIEECILLTQEKIIENEHRLSDLQYLQNKVHEDINNDLKMIQEQIYEILKKHQNSHTSISNICNNQSRTCEQLELMLQAIHEYARLIEEASLTIKHFADVSPRKEYESLDLSPFRSHEVFIMNSSNHTTITTPTSVVTDPSSPISPPDSIQPNSMVTELPQYRLLFEMRRAAVGLKFLYYAHKLNDYKSNCPDNECELGLDLYEDPLITEEVPNIYNGYKKTLDQQK